MKRLIFGLCVFVTCLTVASFGQTKTNDWKGFYAGANIGGAFGGANARTSTVFDSAGYFDPTSVPAVNTAGKQDIGLDGFTGGVQLGVNATAGKTFLIGGEVDFGGLSFESTKTSGADYPCCAGTGFAITQKVSSSWLLTARPRIGITHKNALIYGTGGLAATNIHDRVLFTDTFASALEGGGHNENKAGWTVGGGVEYMAKEHWSFKGEYLYAGFGRITSTSTNLIVTFTGDPAPTAFPTNVFTHSTDLHANIIRVGLNYHF